jgi:hypothetical protein
VSVSSPLSAACAVPCADASCRFAHSSFEQEFHPLQLLRELAVSEAPSNLPPNDPEPIDAPALKTLPAPQTLGVKDQSAPRPECKLARIHSISIYDHETLPEITCVRVTGQASKQRGNVPRSLYVAQGNNVLHLKHGGQVSPARRPTIQLAHAPRTTHFARLRGAGCRAIAPPRPEAGRPHASSCAVGVARLARLQEHTGRAAPLQHLLTRLHPLHSLHPFSPYRSHISLQIQQLHQNIDQIIRQFQSDLAQNEARAMMNAAAPPAPRKATGASRQPPIPCSPCSIFHECLEMGTTAAPRRLDFGGIEIGNQGVPPEFNLSPAAAVFKPHTASPSFTLHGPGWRPDSQSEGQPVESDLSCTSSPRGAASVSSDGEEAGFEVWGTFLEALPTAWLGAAEECLECLESEGSTLEAPEPPPGWWEHLLEDPEPCPEAPAEREAAEVPEITLSETQEVPLARDVPQVTGPCGDIVGGWFQSVDDFCGCADEAGDIHITEDELSPMTRASLCDLVD